MKLGLAPPSAGSSSSSDNDQESSNGIDMDDYVRKSDIERAVEHQLANTAQFLQTIIQQITSRKPKLI